MHLHMERSMHVCMHAYVCACMALPFCTHADVNMQSKAAC